MVPQIHSISIPKLTVAQELQEMFFGLNYDARFKIFNELKQVFEQSVTKEGQLQKSLEKCNTLVLLGANNELILSLLLNICPNDIAQCRKNHGLISLGGRPKLLNYAIRHQIYAKWRTIFSHSYQETDEFDRWILLADCFPKYTLGELFCAVYTAEQEILNDK